MDQIGASTSSSSQQIASSGFHQPVVCKKDLISLKIRFWLNDILHKIFCWQFSINILHLRISCCQFSNNILHLRISCCQFSNNILYLRISCCQFLNNILPTKFLVRISSFQYHVSPFDNPCLCSFLLGHIGGYLKNVTLNNFWDLEILEI